MDSRECRYGTTDHHGPEFYVDDSGEKKWGCYKHVTITNIFRGMKGEQKLRKADAVLLDSEKEAIHPS